MQLTPYHAKYFSYDLLRRRSANDIGKLTASLQDAQVDLNPHQIDAALFAFKSSLSKGALLADEVGLGKTIEAGIILSQQWAERKIEQWNFSALINEGYRDYRDTISPTSSIPRYVFRGFEKACHFEYKFDSKTEQDLAFILENDKQVIKWLRPSPNQFRIYWDHNSKRYEPDFIIETADTIYMLETKMSTQVDALDVQAKKQAAEKYCKHATDYTSQNGGKPWKYGIIPHSSVSRTNSFAFLIAQFVR